ncbi:hypothetical protein HYDPIDRAFT_168600 [Hydnomerulius pinastri MD-312]|uniref:Uncharacterized protein n=1 Tax=Hydnomerulius pinastri MD-312 TaxID=994086 RepID=A0A0C9VYI8_9AGAM|nr:hypothetical protein HYDPIDRAFT_168600 [Hydnomerulius pinastri MD-312]
MQMLHDSGTSPTNRGRRASDVGSPGPKPSMLPAKNPSHLRRHPLAPPLTAALPINDYQKVAGPAIPDFHFRTGQQLLLPNEVAPKEPANAFRVGLSAPGVQSPSLCDSWALLPWRTDLLVEYWPEKTDEGHADSIYMIRGTLFPTSERWNPTLPICGYAQDLAKVLVKKKPDAMPLQPRSSHVVLVPGEL